MTLHRLKPLVVAIALLAIALAGSLCAETMALPAEPMIMDPDQILRSLRDAAPPMPPTDCRALDLAICDRSFPQKAEDVSIRWIRLDTEPGMEAILTIDDRIEGVYKTFVFAKRLAWRLVGTFRCPHTCDESNFVRLQRLTPDSPQLVLFHRESSGKGLTEVATLGYEVRQGRLFPALEVINHASAEGRDPFVESVEMFTSDNRLVIHTVREEPPGTTRRNTCQVRGWDATRRAFVPKPNDQSVYCDSKTGKPISDKGLPTALPLP